MEKSKDNEKMNEIKPEKKRKFFERFSTFDIVLIAMIIGIWYALQQLWYGLCQLFPPIYYWIPMVVLYELLVLPFVIVGGTLINKRFTILLLFILHGLISIVLYGIIFGGFECLVDIISGAAIELFLLTTGNYLKRPLQGGMALVIRAIIYYPISLLITAYVTYIGYAEMVEYMYLIPFGLFILLNILLGAGCGFAGGLYGYYLGKKAKESI